MRCGVRDTGLMSLRGWIRMCVEDGVALHLLRRPLITVSPYNPSAKTHFLRCESVCLYMQTSHTYVVCLYSVCAFFSLMRKND